MSTLSTHESVFVTNVVRALSEESDRLSFLTFIAKALKMTSEQLMPTLPTNTTLEFVNKLKAAIKGASDGNGSKKASSKEERATSSSDATPPVSSGSKRGKKTSAGTERCKGIVKKTGERCVHLALEGTDYCGVHKQ